jgi:sortase A
VSFTAIRVGVGRVVLVAGILVLLFIPYLLWGTGLITARNQAVLTSQFRQAQQQANSHPSSHVTTPAHETTPAAPQVAPTIADPPLNSPVGIIRIPKINLAMTVVEGTGEAQLQMGPGHYQNTPLPGEAGNAAIAGHRTTYLHPFYSLDALVPNDTILITTLQGTFLYSVTGTQIVLPTDVSVVDATTTPQLTLTTCNPRYSASQRLVVHAKLVASELVHAVAPVVAPKVHHKTPAPAPPRKNWAAAIVWGAGVTVLTVGVWLAVLRTVGGSRLAVLGFGTLVWLGVVFFFFQSVAPLLPASY